MTKWSLFDIVGRPAWATAAPSSDDDSAGPVGPDRLAALVLFSQGGSSNKPDEKVTVRRRRRPEPTPGGRERAEAPRRRPPSTGQTPSSGQAAPRPTYTGAPGGTVPRPPVSSTGTSLPIGNIKPWMLIAGLVLLVVCGVPFMLLSGLLKPGDTGQEAYDWPTSTPLPAQVAWPTSTRAVSQPQPVLATSTPLPVIPPSTSRQGQTWLIMLYQDADDKILEQDIYLDLNEAERVGSNDRMQIVAQVDRFNGGYQGDGNWTSAKRFYVTRDADLTRVGSQLVQDMGEVNMSDTRTLVDFVTWAARTYPADKHVLILSDHGMGWPGGWSDPAPASRARANVPLASALGNQMYLMELDEALGTIRAQTGVEQFEMIGLDACLMGHLEVFTALAAHARYAVASQETEPALGWAYTSFLQALQANPDMNGADLGRLIVGSYIQEDQRIVDDQARAEFLRQGSPMGGLYSMFGQVSEAQLAQQLEQSVTLTAIDLQAIPAVIDSVNDLSFALQGANQSAVARARSYTQSFTNIFGGSVPPSYIDLGHFCYLLRQERISAAASQAADSVLSALGAAIIAEKHGPKKPGATGVSIYYPNSQLYGSPVAGPQSYTVIANRFAEASLWDDFLGFHYTGRAFERGAGAIVVPERGITAPGLGQIELSPIELSSDVAAPGRPVVLSTDIRGQNIGYVLLFVGFYDQESNSIVVADTDYLESDVTRELNGVYYPDWGDRSEFTMAFEWEPLVFAIDDGVDMVVAAFTPQSYGATFEQAVYTVDGLYTFADDGATRNARLYFSDGVLRQVFGFTGQDEVSAPREIVPQPGDTFTVYDKWMDLDSQGRVVGTVTLPGGTLVFGEQMFTWKELDAAVGTYIVGFVVQDLDGNSAQVYTQVTVQ